MEKLSAGGNDVFFNVRKTCTTLLWIIVILACIVPKSGFAVGSVPNAVTDNPASPIDPGISSLHGNINVLGIWGYGRCDAVSVQNDTMFISKGRVMEIYDIMIRSSPVLSGSVILKDRISGLFAVGNYVYASISCSGFPGNRCL
jgi:hypothetical protein